MTALTADRDTPRRANVDSEFPLPANGKVFAGALVAIDTATGYATKGVVSTTLKTVGACQEAVDNTGGANGAKRVKVRRGLFRYANSAAGDLIALTDIGNACYIVDDQTVAKTNGAATRSVAGTIRDVDSDGVWIEI